MTKINPLHAFFIGGLCLILISGLYFPRGIAFTPILLGLAGAAYTKFSLNEALKLSKPYLQWALAISALCIASALWSISPLNALAQGARISAVLLGGVFVFSFLRNIPRPYEKNIALALTLCLSLCALACTAEVAFDMPLYRLTHGLGDKKLNTSVMNRSIVILTLCLFPCLAIIAQAKLTNIARKISISALLGSTGLMLYLSQTQSAQLAFIIGILCFWAFPYRIKKIYPALALLIVITLCLTPAIVKFGFVFAAPYLDTIGFLKNGYASTRLEIWNFIMDYAMTNPICGYGLEATRYISAFTHDHIYHADNTVLHPHNVAVQIWIEFGMLGVALASAFIIWSLRTISLMEIPQARATMSVFLPTLSVAAMGYGFWQSWWQGLLILLIALSACSGSMKK